MEDGQLERSVEGHRAGISDICWSLDSSVICSASDDTTLKVSISNDLKFLTSHESLKNLRQLLLCLSFSFGMPLPVSVFVRFEVIHDTSCAAISTLVQL